MYIWNIINCNENAQNKKVINYVIQIIIQIKINKLLLLYKNYILLIPLFVDNRKILYEFNHNYKQLIMKLIIINEIKEK